MFSRIPLASETASRAVSFPSLTLIITFQSMSETKTPTPMPGECNADEDVVMPFRLLDLTAGMHDFHSAVVDKVLTTCSELRNRVYDHCIDLDRNVIYRERQSLPLTQVC
jgi:hypothetical protein